MTFLEFVCERLLGPRAKPGGSPGESYWICPFHNDTRPSFHTLPHKPKYKDRWRCFGCGMRGDDFDLMKECWPGEDYTRRRVRLYQWRQEYEREYPSSFRGPGRAEDDSPEYVERVYADLTTKQRATLAAAVSIARAKNVDLVSIAYYCFHSSRSVKDAQVRANGQLPSVPRNRLRKRR